MGPRTSGSPHFLYNKSWQKNQAPVCKESKKLDLSIKNKGFYQLGLLK